MMLTVEMKEVIFLLKEITYMQGYAVREQSLPESLRSNARKLLVELQFKGLLRIVRSCPSDSLFSCYALCHPLQEISLYDVLVATGGWLHFPAGDFECPIAEYGPAGHYLSVLESMVYRFLSDIRVAEVVLPLEQEREGLQAAVAKGKAGVEKKSSVEESDAVKGRYVTGGKDY